MKKRFFFLSAIAAVIALSAILTSVSNAQQGGSVPERVEGPCDIYAAGGAPCAAAHSTTRALYKKYNGPLYQVVRTSDGKTLDIGVTSPKRGEEGGYADAAAQDEFCADTYCFITIIYDQSPNGNHLIQAPRSIMGPAMGGMDNLPLADLEPVSLNGHKVYGTSIVPGMGMRWNDAQGTAVDDLAEGQYWVINGHHFNDGCCFDYGNAETDSRDDGDGTMETTYFGIKNKWYHGEEPGPWLMTDQENNLVGCVNESPDDKFCETLESITWRFATQMVDGAPHRWRNMAGNAQEGALDMLYDGGRIKNERSSYDPMRKQGAILLGNGGDNGNVSSGTFYEGAMTEAGTFPGESVNQAIQANIVSAKYKVAALQVAATERIETPDGMQTWTPGSKRQITVKYTNTTGETASDVMISLALPKGWKSQVLGSPKSNVSGMGAIAPDETAYAHFLVTSSSEEYNGDLVAKATWKGSKKEWSETAHTKVRNVKPVKINEFRIADNAGNATNSFIELFNASDSDIDISGWTLTQHAKNIPYSSSIRIPSGTTIAAREYYLLGLSNSGMAVEASRGDTTIYVRDVKGISEGDEIEIGTGRDREVRTVKAVVNLLEDPAKTAGTPSNPSFIFQPLPNGPDDRMYMNFPAGTTSLPLTGMQNVKEGQKIAIGYGGAIPAYGETRVKYEVLTVTSVGTPGVQAHTTAAAAAGSRTLRVSNINSITPGDQILLDINSKGHGKELITVRSVTDELELTKPLKYSHSANIPFAVMGTGVGVYPKTAREHLSNEPVFSLVYAIDLDRPLDAMHPVDDVVYDAGVKDAGYQDDVPADQLFGGPALAPNGGNMVLRNAKGLVVDALNYGRVVDTQYSEGYHGESGKDAMGRFVKTPYITNKDGYNNPVADAVLPNLSAGRFPDGYDTDNNKYDFRVQPSFHLAAGVPEGGSRVVFHSSEGLKPGQMIYIGDESDYEYVQVATVGSMGATAIRASLRPGDRYVQVEDATDFAVGQPVLINGHRATISDIQTSTASRGQAKPAEMIVLKAPVDFSAPQGTLITGTGAGLSTPLKNAHKIGEAVSVNKPTPGRPNVY